MSQSERSPSDLTPRQREITALIAEGLTNQEIADGLNIRLAAAAVDVVKIMGMLGASTRLEVAVWFRNHASCVRPQAPGRPAE